MPTTWVAVSASSNRYSGPSWPFNGAHEVIAGACPAEAKTSCGGNGLAPPMQQRVKGSLILGYLWPGPTQRSDQVGLRHRISSNLCANSVQIAKLMPRHGHRMTDFTSSLNMSNSQTAWCYQQPSLQTPTMQRQTCPASCLDIVETSNAFTLGGLVTPGKKGRDGKAIIKLGTMGKTASRNWTHCDMVQDSNIRHQSNTN